MTRTECRIRPGGRRCVFAALAVVVMSTGVASAQDSRAAALGRARAWLEARPERPQSARQGLDDPKSRATAAIRLWLAEIAAGEGPVGAKVVTLERAVAASAGGETVAMGAYANWMSGFAAIPLVEKSLREGRADPALRRAVLSLEEHQNPEGGWAHGTAGEMTSFYPTTLVITTDFALFALGMARRLHLRVDEDVVERGMRLLFDVQGAGGAFPYGGRVYRKGFEAGRTAGAIAAFAALGQTDGDRFRRACAYLVANMAATPDGHASPAIHVMWGGVASAILGGEAQRAWDETVLKRVLAAQAADGSFRDVVEGSPDSMSLLGDASTNTEYVTALYAAAMAARDSRIAKSLKLPRTEVASRGESAMPSSRAQSRPGSPPESWTAAVPAVALDCDESRVAVLGPGGEIGLFDAETGRRTCSASVPGVTGAGEGSVIVIDRDTVFAFALTARDDDEVLVGGAVQAAAAHPAAAGRLAAIAADGGAVRWSCDVTGAPASWAATPSGLWARRRSGSLTCFDRATGAVLEERSGPAVPVNTTAAWFAGGKIAATDEATLVLRDAAGDELWREKLRAPRGVHPPAWTSLFPDGAAILGGSTDGKVGAWSLDGGKKLWSVDLGAAVLGVARSADAKDFVLALTDDGRVIGLKDGKVAWTSDVGSGREPTHESRMRVRGGKTWIASVGSEALVNFESRDGRILSSLPLPRGAAWTTFGDVACVAAGGTLRCWRVTQPRKG